MTSQGLQFHEARAAWSQVAAAPFLQSLTLWAALPPHSLHLPADMQGCELFLPSQKTKLGERD